LTDDLGEREPVRPTPPRTGTERERDNRQRLDRRTGAEKLARRLAGLPAGRYELVITIGDDGALADWSVRWFGKVEQP
jgi:hypothetical protein